MFEGHPHLDTVETVELHEAGGVTTMTIRTTYRDKARRDEGIQGGFDGIEDSFDQLEDLLRSLLDAKGTVSG